MSRPLDRSRGRRNCFRNAKPRCQRWLDFGRNWRCLGPRWHASKCCFEKEMFGLLLWLNTFEATPIAVERSSSVPTILKVEPVELAYVRLPSGNDLLMVTWREQAL
ncbi:hypothetical protein ACLOJK_015255 [Asimina triloba]